MQNGTAVPPEKLGVKSKTKATLAAAGQAKLGPKLRDRTPKKPAPVQEDDDDEDMEEESQEDDEEETPKKRKPKRKASKQHQSSSSNKKPRKETSRCSPDIMS